MTSSVYILRDRHLDILDTEPLDSYLVHVISGLCLAGTLVPGPVYNYIVDFLFSLVVTVPPGFPLILIDWTHK